MAEKEILYDDSYMQLLEGTDEPMTDVEFDPDAEYNRPAPPIHDGWYYGKASNSGVYVDGVIRPYKSAQWKNETKPHYEVAVKVEIVSIDPLYNGKHVYTGFPLTSVPDPDRNNASGISAAYRAMAGEPIKGVPGLSHATQLDALLQTQPMVKVRVQNVLKDVDADKAFGEKQKAGTLAAGEERPKSIYGQKKIMALKGGTDSKGNFTGAADHPQTGERCPSRAQIVEFKAATSDQAVKE